MGHSDFYVNYANAQLGCPVNKTFGDVLSVDKSSLTQGEILPGCNHKRSFKYFIEAFGNEKCTFLGIHCDSVQNFSMVKNNKILNKIIRIFTFNVCKSFLKFKVFLLVNRKFSGAD